MRVPRSLLLHIHIPKVGGTTLTTVFRKVYRHERVLHLGKIAEVRRFRDAGPQLSDRFDVISGHVGFEAFEDVETYAREHGRTVHYVTLFRDPLARFVSYYRHIVRDPHHGLHAAVEGMSVDVFFEYCCAERPQDVRNVQCRMATGRSEFAAARRVLEEKYLCHGVLDRFDSFVQRLAGRLGWPELDYEPRNVATPTEEPVVLNSANTGTFWQLNADDREIFRHAQSTAERPDRGR